VGFQPVGKTPGQIAAQRQKVKRSGLRAIDAGTRYDLTGNLRRMAREIERGEHGDVSNIVLVAQKKGPLDRGRGSCYVAHYGAGTTPEVHWMLATAMNRIEPA
jgi:hypothetical protein